MNAPYVKSEQEINFYNRECSIHPDKQSMKLATGFSTAGKEKDHKRHYNILDKQTNVDTVMQIYGRKRS